MLCQDLAFLHQHLYSYTKETKSDTGTANMVSSSHVIMDKLHPHINSEDARDSNLAPPPVPMSL